MAKSRKSKKSTKHQKRQKRYLSRKRGGAPTIIKAVVPGCYHRNTKKKHPTSVDPYTCRPPYSWIIDPTLSNEELGANF